jgi:hypothetical protein
MQETLDYTQAVSGDTKITNETITIAAGEVVEKFTPLVFDAATGHYKAAGDAATAAHLLSSFAVDATAGAKKHAAIKSICIDPDFVNYPAGMSATAKAGLFAGTPISVQSPA